MWRLWLQGENDEPDICKACLRSLRRWYPDKNIITLNQNNLSDYITLPDYIEDKYKQGYITHTHYSDLVRLQLLAQYGGIWTDATVYFTGRKHDKELNLPLFTFRETNYYDTYTLSSWFISSQAHHPIITLARDICFEYWRTHYFLLQYFLINMCLDMASEVYQDEFHKIPFIDCRPSVVNLSLPENFLSTYSEKKMNQLAEISDIHKLSYKFDDRYGLPREKSYAFPENSIAWHIINS